MKKIILFQLILLLSATDVLAQAINCNRSVWVKDDEQKLPKEVCIPQGYLISTIYDTTDINGDGLSDFIFKWRRPHLQDGDTLFVSVYTQNKDGSFSNFHTFNNLFPIHFENYDSDYTLKNQSLKTIHTRYLGRNPFVDLLFLKGTIEITLKADAISNIIITYEYDKEIKNWRQKQTILYDFVANTRENYNSAQEKGATIDFFSYTE